MALSESQRNQIAGYKIRIESLRRDLEHIAADKKRRMDYLTSQIKSASTDRKRVLRADKIRETNNYKTKIENKREDINNLKEAIARIKN